MWCYTTDPDKKWEYCDVKRCHATYSCQKGDPLGVRMNVTASETVLIPADIYGCDIIPWLVRLGTRAQQGHTRTACDIRPNFIDASFGPFRPFFGPQGAEMERSLLAPHPEGATRQPSRPECTQVTLADTQNFYPILTSTRSLCTTIEVYCLI